MTDETKNLHDVLSDYLSKHGMPNLPDALPVGQLTTSEGLVHTVMNHALPEDVTASQARHITDGLVAHGYMRAEDFETASLVPSIPPAPSQYPPSEVPDGIPMTSRESAGLAALVGPGVADADSVELTGDFAQLADTFHGIPREKLVAIKAGHGPITGPELDTLQTADQILVDWDWAREFLSDDERIAAAQRLHAQVERLQSELSHTREGHELEMQRLNGVVDAHKEAAALLREANGDLVKERDGLLELVEQHEKTLDGYVKLATPGGITFAPAPAATNTAPVPPRSISPLGAKFLAVMEGGIRNFPYDDHTGRQWDGERELVGYLTIGVGHAIFDHEMPRAREWMLNGITDKQALELLREDLVRFEAEVVDLQVQRMAQGAPAFEQHEFDALVVFCFNIGTGAFAQSTLWRRLAEFNTQAEACEHVREQLPRWRKSRGVVMDGLVKRRQQTIELYCEADYIPEWFATQQQVAEIRQLANDSPVVTRSGNEAWVDGERFVKDPDF